MNTWIVIMIAGLASMGIPVLSLGATEVPPTIGPPPPIVAGTKPPPILDNVIIEETDESAVIQRVKDCTVPNGTRGFWAGADLGPNFSIGSSVQTQLIRYNITKGKASLNSQGIGGGMTLRYYNNGWMAPTTLKDGHLDRGAPRDIRNIKPGCRATTWAAKTFDEDLKNAKIAFPLVSVTLGAFAGKTEDSQDLSFQPALIVGLFRDLLNFGVGVNASGPDKGHTFLMLGLGTGFNF